MFFGSLSVSEIMLLNLADVEGFCTFPLIAATRNSTFNYFILTFV